MKKKLTGLIATVAVIIVATLGFFIYQHNSIPTNVSAEVSLAKGYNNISELKGDASVIAEVTIQNTKSIEYGDLPFTISEAKVNSVIKGNIKEGDTINLFESGGTYTPKNKNNKPVDKTFNMQFDGVNVAQKDDHLIIFANQYVGPVTSESAYVPIGVYQGKFKVENGKVVQQIPKDHKKLDDYNNSDDLNAFVNRIKKTKETVPASQKPVSKPQS